MTRRLASPYMLGVAAVTMAIGATASAQTTTTSTQRIPVVKEAGGEVSPAKVDTLTVYRTDTTRIYSTDTLRMNVPGPVTVVTHVDTVTVTTPAMSHPMINKAGFYFGAGVGPALPYGSLQSVNQTAVAGQLQVGWQGLTSVVGVRGDVNYAQYSQSSEYADFGPRPDVVNGSLDLKLQIPGVTHMFGYAPMFSVYALGGGTYSQYRNLRMTLDAQDVGVGSLNAEPPNSAWHDHLGWNAGGGIAFHWRATDLFAEARVISFNTAVTPAARQVPIVFGMDWY